MKQTLLILLLFPMALLAQESPKPSTWSAKINLPQLLDFVAFPTVGLSVEKKISPAFALIAEGGVQLYDSPNRPDTTFVKSGGFKANVEFRVYLMQLFHFGEKFRSGGLFTGVQLFHRENKGTATFEYDNPNYVADPDNPYDYSGYSTEDNFGFKKKMTGVHLTAGIQINHGRFLFEPAVGLGWMYRKTTNTYRDYNPEIHEETSGHDIFGMDNQNLSENSGSRLSGSFNLRLGYNF